MTWSEFLGFVLIIIGIAIVCGIFFSVLLTILGGNL